MTEKITKNEHVSDSEQLTQLLVNVDVLVADYAIEEGLDPSQITKGNTDAAKIAAYGFLTMEQLTSILDERGDDIVELASIRSVLADKINKGGVAKEVENSESYALLGFQNLRKAIAFSFKHMPVEARPDIEAFKPDQSVVEGYMDKTLDELYELYRANIRPATNESLWTLLYLQTTVNQKIVNLEKRNK